MPKTKSVKNRQILKTEIWIREPIYKIRSKNDKILNSTWSKSWALISFHKRHFKETSQRKKLHYRKLHFRWDFTMPRPKCKNTENTKSAKCRVQKWNDKTEIQNPHCVPKTKSAKKPTNAKNRNLNSWTYKS